MPAGISIDAAPPAASLDEAEAAIDRALAAPDAPAALTRLLAEDAPLYRGRGTAEAERLRGRVLAGFAKAGLLSSALPQVLAELETGLNPLVVAGAARALAGAEAPPAEALDLLAAAASRIRSTDAPTSPDLRPPLGAVTEIVLAMARHGAPAVSRLRVLRAEGGWSAAVTAALAQAIATAEAAAPKGCCGGRSSTLPVAPAAAPGAIDDLPIQDQSGAVMRFADLFAGRPAAIAFFYTRCMNPQKCSLTISRLAAVKARLRAAGLAERAVVAAFTYDPAYDTPRQLEAYGRDRGFPFDAHCRLLRTTGPLDPLQAHFELGVGFGPATVNQHRIDLAVTAADGRIVLSHAHRLWDEAEVFETLAGQIRA
ncbi:SCO family protein [Caulobacter sp. CCNWLY153]|uniref:SCO family protein n=1 Tax=unclassified Caulobacter TaxID=2648921 RepID=UPI002FF16BB8